MTIESDKVPERNLEPASGNVNWFMPEKGVTLPNDHFLSIKKMLELKDYGVNITDSMFVVHSVTRKIHLASVVEEKELLDYFFPVYTLGEILHKMPKIVEYNKGTFLVLKVYPEEKKVGYYERYKDHGYGFTLKNLVASAADAWLFVLQNKLRVAKA